MSFFSLMHMKNLGCAQFGLVNFLMCNSDYDSIVGVDKQAYGGTHVKNLREIGKVELMKTENKGKNNRRIYFRLN